MNATLSKKLLIYTDDTTVLFSIEWAVFYVPAKHSIGYMGDGFHKSKDPTNSIKVLKEMLQKRKKTTKTT